MKKIVQSSILLLLVAIGFYYPARATQLSGTYIINSSGAASGNTFLNFASAIAYLTGTGSRTDGGPANTAPFGVSGPVVFMVASGTYTEQVTLKGVINGASTVNTITFEGSDPATRTITYAATAAALRHTVKLDSTQYVSFRNFSIVATGAQYGWAVFLTNTNSKANKIIGCTISVTGVGATSTSANYCGIVLGGNVSTATTGIGMDSIQIDSNTINSGFYGIIASGLTTFYQKANTIRFNKIYNSYSYGIYTVYQDGINISDNILVLRKGIATSNGILVMNSNSANTATGVMVNRNRVSGFGVYGIRINTVANNYLGTKGQLCNNMVGGGILAAASFPIAFGASNYWNVCNNTVNHDIAATAFTNAALSITGGANINVLNNIFAETRGGLGLPVYASTSSAIDTINYNVYYRSDTSNGQLLFLGGANFNTGTFKRTGITDSNSLFQKPVFVNDTDLRLLHACNKGVALPYIITDVFGTTRGIVPVIGAHEALPVADNIALMEILSPKNPIDTITQDLAIRIKNVGNNTITSFTISYVHNNGTPVVLPWTGTLAACDTTTVLFTGGNSIHLTAANYIRIYTNQPNGVADGNPVDDTLKVKYFHVLNGTYTVGTGGEFNSLSDVSEALQLRGVSGPVTFMVNPGTYTGPFVLNGPIAGTSSTNTITFEGSNAGTRTITASVASGATVLFNQCSYVRLRNLTVNNTFAGSGTGIAFVGSNNNVNGSSSSIKYCRINMANLNTATAYAINITGSANGYASSNQKMDSIEIDSNIIAGTNFGINIYGNTVASNNLNHAYKMCGNTITTTDAQGDRGIFITNVYNGVETNYNTINSEGGTGIYYSSCGNNFAGNTSHQINNNNLNVGGGGIQMDQSLCTASNTTKILNNRMFIHSLLVATGILIQGGGIDEIYHNTIQIDSSSSLLIGMCFNYEGSPATKVKNNIFAYSGGGTGTVYPVYITSGVLGDNLNYNVYYNAAGNDLVSRNGSVYGNANLLTDSTGGDSSFNMQPAFASNNNLHLTTGCPRGTDLSALVSTDFDGVIRSLSPSIGCYEFGGYANDVQVLQITQPTIPVTLGAQDMQVLIANNGNNTVTSFNVSYTLNGGTPVVLPWSGLLNACDTISVIFTGAKQLNVINGINLVKVYTSAPNSVPDGNVLNDTITKQFAPALSGNYTIGVPPSDFVSFTAAANALDQRGVSGWVVFNVKSGTYTEAVTIPNIMGASAVNTVVFRSIAGHQDSVLITNTAANQATVTLRNASYVHLKDMTIRQLNIADYNSALFLGGTCSYDTIENCKMIVPPYVANPLFPFHTNGLTGTSVVVRNNYMQGGYGGIAVNLLDGFLSPNTATSNHIFENNTVDNGSYYGAFFYQVANLTLRNNTILPDPLNTQYTGIQLESCDSAMLVTGNKIRGAAGGFGMYINDCWGLLGAGAIISNNEISIGSNTSAEGIHVIASTRLRFYHNSVNVLSTSSINTAAGYFNGSTEFVLKNNVFSNTGGGLALNVNAPYTFDYNNLYTTGATLAKYNSTNYASLATWKNSVGGPDNHSVSYRPGFTSSTNLQPNVSDSASWSLNGRGVQVAADTIDINNHFRPSVLAEGVPDIGAYEFTPTALPPQAVPNILAPVPGDTQVFVSIFTPKDTVAKIYWNPINPNFPSKMTVRQYTGEKPKAIGSALNYMYFYTDFDGESTDLYNYDIDLYYQKTWLGTIPNEPDLRITKKAPNIAWTVDISGFSQIDITRGVLRTQFQTDSSAVYSGTDMFNPLPVKLLSVSASKLGNNAIVTWTTASEFNSNLFEVERAFDGKTFAAVGNVKALGNNTSSSTYHYTDINPLAQANGTIVYYRLKMVDKDGGYAYSTIVNVNWGTNVKDRITVFPNPFTKELFVTIETANTTGAKVEWMDITGKIISTSMTEIEKGATAINVLPFEVLNPGIYFMSIEMDNTKTVYKVIKQ